MWFFVVHYTYQYVWGEFAYGISITPFSGRKNENRSGAGAR